MLVPLDSSNVDRGVNILVRAFPKRSSEFWNSTCQNLLVFNKMECNTDEIGLLLIEKNDCVGIILLAKSRRQRQGKDLEFVNMSCWYIDEAYRWMGPAMMMRAMKDKDAIYTDFTPAPVVQKMLDALKFKLTNKGVMFLFTPLYRLHSDRDRAIVKDITSNLEQCNDPELKRLLKHHAGDRLLVCQLSAQGRQLYFVVKRRKYAGISSGILVYASDTNHFYQNLEVVLKCVFNSAIFFLQVDIIGDRKVKGAINFPAKSKKYFRNAGTSLSNKIDYLGSELSLIDYQ